MSVLERVEEVVRATRLRWWRRMKRRAAAARKARGMQMLRPKMIERRRLYVVVAGRVDSGSGGGVEAAVVITEMLIIVEIWPLESEVKLVRVAVLVVGGEGSGSADKDVVEAGEVAELLLEVLDVVVSVECQYSNQLHGLRSVFHL